MSELFVGTQCMPQTPFDEGVDHMLDFMRQEGGINTLCISTHVYHGGGLRPGADGNLADHGTAPVYTASKPLTKVFVPHDNRYFGGTSLRMHQASGEVEDLGGVDVLTEVIDAAHKRSMRVYARHLEGFHDWLAQQQPNFIKVSQIDAWGRRTEKPCWNHPEYRLFWHGYVEDIIKRYAVDGLYLGAERDGPLGPVLNGGDVPVCFCEHCHSKAKLRDIPFESARLGFRELHALSNRTNRPADGMLVNIMRLWMRYPGIMAWEQLQNESKWSLFAELYGTAKVLRPSLEVGWHLPMYGLVYDIFSRAAWDYTELARSCDFIKPSIYFDVNLARFNKNIPGLRNHLWRDLRSETLYSFVLDLLGLDAAGEARYEDSESAPFSSAYVGSETRRAVQGCAGAAKVYAGIGVDIPHPKIKPDPQRYYHAAKAALEAGAQGLLLSREYHFMRKDSLNAVKQAVNEFTESKKNRA